MSTLSKIIIKNKLGYIHKRRVSETRLTNVKNGWLSTRGGPPKGVFVFHRRKDKSRQVNKGPLQTILDPSLVIRDNK